MTTFITINTGIQPAQNMRDYIHQHVKEQQGHAADSITACQSKVHAADKN
jgi:hypothetical protein